MTKQNYMICNSAEDDSTIFMDLDETEAKLLEDVFGRLNDNRSRYAPNVTISPMTVKVIKKNIWTMVYRPFVMGGQTDTPISTVVPIIEQRTINGFDFFSFKTPSGSLKICEATTGGIIADSFDDIEKSINDVPVEILLKQINDARPLAAKASSQTNEEFFSLYKY